MALQQAFRRSWTPPPRISVPDWADQHRKLAKEAGSTSGNWDTSTVEVARGPMLAVTEPGVHIITTMCCTQLLKTELLTNVFGYFAHLDPCPMLLLQPKEAAAEQFSKERITPFIRVTPVLRQLVGTGKTRSADETLLYKAFPGGFLALAGAGSPDNLARRPIRVLLCDEVDKYPAIREGDPISLAEERTASFGVNWLSLRACSPTLEGFSRIETSYAESDQRRASVMCPHCQHRQFLEFFDHVHWSKDGVGQHLPGTARLFCEACGTAWSEGQRLRALGTCRWHQTRPFHCCGQRHVPLDAYGVAWRASEGDPMGRVWDWWSGDRWAVYRARCPDCGSWPVGNKHAGFQASKLYSPWTRDTPADVAERWLAAKDDEDRKLSWWNTQMGRPYRPNVGKEMNVDGLAARGEVWPAEVPDGVAVITVGADFQGYRGEFEVVGWGREEESWSIAHHVIEGDPTSPEFWKQVDAFMQRTWHRADGRGFEVMAACLDSGHHTQRVYQFAKDRLGRRIWAVKGASERSGQRSPVWPTKRPSSKQKASYRPTILGVSAAKDVIRARLQLTTAGPGYMHFPADREVGYFAQLTAERLVTKSVGGHKIRVWELPPGRANEALDCRVYAYAALCGLAHFGLKLNHRADQVAVQPPAVVDPPTHGTRLITPTQAAPAAATRPEERSGQVTIKHLADDRGAGGTVQPRRSLLSRYAKGARV